MVAQKCFYDLQPFIVVKRGAAVCRAVHHYELNGSAGPLIRPRQFVGLVDRHLRILIAVQQQQRRVVFVDVKHRAGQMGELLFGVGLAAEQQLQGGDTDVQAIRRRLG